MNCDETFAVYLRDVSSRVNSEFYKKVLLFILCYREALNKHGWDKLPHPERESEEEANREKLKEMHFCQVNNAEHVPDCSNELITSFLEDHNTGLERNVAIDLT